MSSGKGLVSDYIARFKDDPDRYLNRTKPAFLHNSYETWWIKAHHIVRMDTPEYAIVRTILIYAHFEPWGA